MHQPFPRRIFHVEVSVKVTSIVRCKLTSLESCKMSGCDNKHQCEEIKLALCHTTELLNTGRQNTKKIFTLSCLRNSQQNHKMSLICLIHKSVRSLESASDTYHTWGRQDTNGSSDFCAAYRQNTLPRSSVTKRSQCPAEPSRGTKLFISPEFTGQSIPLTTEIAL